MKKPQTSPGRGGARKGAGRKPPESGAKELITLRLAPDVVRLLKEMPSDTRAALVESAVRLQPLRELHKAMREIPPGALD